MMVNNDEPGGSPPPNDPLRQTAQISPKMLSHQKGSQKDVVRKHHPSHHHQLHQLHPHQHQVHQRIHLTTLTENHLLTKTIPGTLKSTPGSSSICWNTDQSTFFFERPSAWLGILTQSIRFIHEMSKAGHAVPAMLLGTASGGKYWEEAFQVSQYDIMQVHGLIGWY